MDKFHSWIIFRFINIIVGVFMFLGGLWQIIFDTDILGFPRYLTAAYYIFFGVINIIYEFHLPSRITEHTSFMFSLLGRGVFYIFIGSLILGPLKTSIIAGVFIIFFGLLYVILSFIPVIETPVNMRPESFNPHDPSYRQTLG